MNTGMSGFSFIRLSLLVLFLGIMSHNYTTVRARLSTNSRWIVNERGQRVKLACVNWPAHVDALVPEGLNKQPLETITKKIASMGFNCVRLTWAEFMISDPTLSSLTVRQSFKRLGLNKVIADIQKNNPFIIDLPIIKAFQDVVHSLGKNRIGVILDNHKSTPGWCCSKTDGNGFFGDRDFNPDRWIQSLSKMATLYRGFSNVIGMSLRNELRGPRVNTADWYRYMQKGAEAVHAANPDVLIILSGLNFDLDLSFLKRKPVSLSFKGKLVFEVHRYAFSGGFWNNPKECVAFSSRFNTSASFLLDRGFPLFVSEFGVDQDVKSPENTNFLNCFFGILSKLNLDWAVWSLQGSYYIREGKVDEEEHYGMLTKDWNGIRNPSFLERLRSIQH